MNNKKRYLSRIIVSLSIISGLVLVVLALLVHTTISNTFISTGVIDINLNDGVVVFDEDDLNLQPSQSVRKEMFIENVGTEDFYYRIYLEEVSGELVDVTLFNIYDEYGNLLKTIETSKFNSTNYFSTDEIVEVGECLYFEIEIVFNELLGDEYQGGNLNFHIIASAIQSKNNQ